MSNPFTVPVDPDIIDLAEGFLEHRREAAQQARMAITAADWEVLYRIGHELKGTAGSYGFRALSSIGLELEDAALTRNLVRARDAVLRMSEYIDRATVIPR